VSVTCVAGRGGGTAAKPVGLVHLACAAKGRPTVHRECRFGDLGRDRIRRESVAVAFDLVTQQLGR
jgi:nicotinamide-nucleotide amidase